MGPSAMAKYPPMPRAAVKAPPLSCGRRRALGSRRPLTKCRACFSARQPAPWPDFFSRASAASAHAAATPQQRCSSPAHRNSARSSEAQQMPMGLRRLLRNASTSMSALPPLRLPSPEPDGAAKVWRHPMRLRRYLSSRVRGLSARVMASLQGGQWEVALR